MTTAGVPRVLLVEDDPVSRAFLTVAVQATPAEVDGADTLAAALALAQSHDYALWLFDANLPDGSAVELLHRLRRRFPHTPALAHTAAANPDVHEKLLGAGFLEVLVKPLPAVAVRDALRRVLGPTQDPAIGPAFRPGSDHPPIWDDEAAALALNGNSAHIASLRALFIDELPTLRSRIGRAVQAGDRDGVLGELHKLRASCGFVGATRLGDAARALHQHPDSPALLARFDQTAAGTLADFQAAGFDQPGSPSD